VKSSHRQSHFPASEEEATLPLPLALPPPAVSLADIFLRVGNALHHGGDDASLEQTLAALLNQIPNLLQCRLVALWLPTEESGEALRCEYVAGVPLLSQRGRTVVPDSWSALFPQGASCITLDSRAALRAWTNCFPDCLPYTTTSLVAVALPGGSGPAGILYAVRDIDQALPFTLMDAETLSAIAGYAALAVQHVHLREQNRREQERRLLLDHISEYLQRTLDLETLIHRIFGEVNKAIHAEAQSIWMVDWDAGDITCRFATGPGAAAVRQIHVGIGEGIVGKTVLHQEAFLVADAQQDARHSRRADQKTGLITRSLISVPMVHEGRAIGAIQAMNKAGGALFDSDDLDMLRSIADIAALAVENARLYAELHTSYDTTLDALMAALDARDHETEGHSRRVAAYTVRLAEEIGLGRDEIRRIRRGALLHDIGKIGVPDAILHKNGPLTPEERSIVQGHPLTGFAMLRGIAHLRGEVQIVLTHQERWDGGGYPQGLKGADIPLEARLFMIADTFDAILSDRPYRKGRTYEIARQEIAAESGRQFDPALVESFLRISDAEWEIVRQLAEPPVYTA
jgi:HD-GYP domain-containing protein (c-di-GMP phosphodiesterase class II)